MDVNTGDGGANSGLTKKAKKRTYEKQLEEIQKELQLKSSNVTAWKGAGLKRQKMKPEQELMLLEQKSILLLKLKRHKDVVDDGYSTLGRMGSSVVIYKSILIALVRLGKPEDDIKELLDAWTKATPKCPNLIETKRKFDGFFSALRSGMKHSDLFSSIEEALGLNADSILNKVYVETTDDKKWRFRAPPPRHTTFSLCPRSLSGNSCIYGDDCLFAHSQEELKEWRMRTDGDTKNNNARVDDDEDGSSKSTVSKKRPVPTSYRSLLIPPLCIHYLQDLGSKIKDAVDIKSILTDDISGVKMKIEQNLHYQRRIDGVNKVQCTWVFKVMSKTPMATVTVLHDANREYFGVSSATFYNKKKEKINLIDLHPNNKVQTKLQVLNTFIQPSLFLRFNSGWPEMCYYKVDITFESRDPFPDTGLYRQSIVFDFKKDPKVVKHITVEILPKIEPIGNHLSEVTRKSVWGAATPPPASPVDPLHDFNAVEMDDRESIETDRSSPREVDSGEFITRRSDFPSLEQCLATPANERELAYSKYDTAKSNPDAIYDSETGKVVSVKGAFASGDSDNLKDKENNLFLSDVPLTKENYCTWMCDFLQVELAARQKSVSDLKKTLDVEILGEYSVSPDCIYKYSSTIGEVYGKIESKSGAFSSDNKLERLITTTCSNVIISSCKDELRHRGSPKRYFCKIIERAKSTIILAIGRKAADELLLISNTKRSLQIQFVLDVVYLDRVKCCLECLNKHHMDILFPTFSEERLPFLKILDGVGMIFEEEYDLNPRQLNVYNLLVGRKVLIERNDSPPPLLLIGGVSTGKSHVIAHCVRALLRSFRNVPAHRILVCTRSDLSADVYINEYFHPWLINDQLSVQRSKPLRIYGEDRFPDTVSGIVKHYCLFNTFGTSFRYPTKEEVLSHRIILVTFSTCTELIRLGLDDDTFTHIILDEVGPCLEAECVQPLVLAGRGTKLLISGDLMRTQSQMFAVFKGVPPLSILERLRNSYPYKHPFVVNLVDNYTNHEVIVKFISEVYYNDHQRSARSQPSHPTFYPLSFHHIPSSRELQAEDDRGYFNMEEITYTLEFIDELQRTWPEAWGPASDKDSIVIVTPYPNQVISFNVQLQLKGIHTVDVKLLAHIAGRKYKVVIMSTVVSYRKDDVDVLDGVSDGGFFTDRRLLFDALSSARYLAVVFGDAFSLWRHGACSDIWRKFLTLCHRNNSLKDFSPQTGKVLKAEDGSVIGSPSTPRQTDQKIVSPDRKPGEDIKKLSVNQKPSEPKPTSQQATLIHTENISPSHGMGFLGMGMSPEAKNMLSPMDLSWNINVTSLQEPPKTDLFSAFSMNTEPLYSSRSHLQLTRNPEANAAPGAKLFQKSYNLGPELEEDTNKNSVYKPLPLNGILNQTPEVKEEGSKVKELLHHSHLSSMNPQEFPRSSFKSSEVYKHPFQCANSPLQLPSLLGEYPTGFNDTKLRRMDGPISVEPQLEAKPIRSLLSPAETSFENYVPSWNGGSSNHHLTPLMSPLLRGPPGFAPISTVEANIGNFSSPENKLSALYSSPQHVGAYGNRLVSSKISNYWKSNGFEVPPRMLKNLHLTSSTYRSPTRTRNPKPQFATKPTRPTEMNFFDELGLSSQSTLQNDTGSRCDSAASSVDDQYDDQFMDGNDANIQDTNMENNFEHDEWIEVRSSRKGKHQPVKKVKASKQKYENNTSEESKTKEASEMYFDKNIELMVQMGFNKSHATKALQACGKDLQQAIDWLFSKEDVNKNT